MDIVVVGASVAGVRAAKAAREAGFDGRVTVVGAEEALPYDRPPLSKEFLVGDATEDDIRLWPTGDAAPLDADLVLGAGVTTVDLDTRRVTLSAGASLPFDGLLLATGAMPRPLRCPGVELPGVHYLRTLDDARSLRAAMAAAGRLLIVGSGFIGGEVASSARTLGLDVTIVEVAPTAFSNAVGPPIAEALVAAHRADGVKVLCGRSVSQFRGRGAVESAVLSDGSEIEIDIAVIGIGATPNVGFLAGSSIACADGVECDEFCHASAPGVYAAGDVCRWFNPRYSRSMRVEHWTNAVEQADRAARNLVIDLAGFAAERRPYSAIPYFWSHQCGSMYQYVGTQEGAMSISLEGDVGGRRWGVVARDGDCVASAFTANWPALSSKYRRHMLAQQTQYEILDTTSGPSI